ncbi:MAG: YraN family protein [Sarcina sp.]
MKKFNKLIGNFGEKIAFSLLQNEKHNIIETNFHTKFGEIDIISFDKDILVFTEVKTRVNKLYGTPAQSISYYKMKNIIKVAKQYIYYKKFYTCFIRFDVIEIEVSSSSKEITTNHIKDAFRAN